MSKTSTFKPIVPQNETKSTKPHIIIEEDINQCHKHYVPSNFKYSNIPIFEMTQKLFESPYDLVDELYAKNYDQYGIVKLIPPQNMVDKSVLNRLIHKLSNQKITTRIQTINELQTGQPFLQNQQGQSLKSFIDTASQFDAHYQSQIPRISHNESIQNECEFWTIVDNPNSYDEVQVEYAADLPVNKFASGFDETKKKQLNLNHINQLSEGIFQVLKDKSQLSGITIPWLYFGMKFACFCWHQEDLFLSSINYMHYGSSKIWYAIPPRYRQDFEKLFYDKFGYLMKKNPHLLHDIICMISPMELAKHNIPILRTEQKPGEFLITLGSTYHAGFSNGFNCSEAVNIAPTVWLNEYDKAVKLYRSQESLKTVQVSFPLDWLLIQVAQNINKLMFNKKHLKDIRDKLKYYVDKEKNQMEKLTSIYNENVEFRIFEKNTLKYDRFSCSICKDYMYLSYLFCKKCLKKGCIHHVSVCSCFNNKVLVFSRFCQEDLQNYLKRLEK